MGQKTGTEVVTAGGSADEAMLRLGTSLGMHHAFSRVANRCTAADAECLRSIRESGSYKRLGLTWEQFCTDRAGIGRTHADRLIRHLEEFGANYFRLAGLLEVSPVTYRLIAGDVTEEGMRIGDETVPLCPENRERIAAVVNQARRRAKAPPEAVGNPSKIAELRRLMREFMRGAGAVAGTTGDRAELMALLEEGERQIGTLSRKVKEKTLVLR